VKHGEFKYVGYTGIFNVLDYSAVSFPTGIKVDAQKDAAYEPNEPFSHICKAVQELCMNEQEHDNAILTLVDNAKDVDGMPISLQLVARRLEEEKLFAMLEIVNNAL
jgi:amidase